MTLNKEDKPLVIDNINSKINYLIQGPEQEADKRKSIEIMLQSHREFKDLFTLIWCFNDTFLLLTKLET